MEGSTDARKAVLRRAYDAAVQAADPVRAMRDAWPEPPSGRIVVLALGKAAARMAAAAERHYASAGTAVVGVAAVPRGHAEATRRVRVLEGGHPLPDEGSLRAGRALLDAARDAGEDDLVLALVSGGGSAVAVAPIGLELEDLADLGRALLASGADIAEINAVRRRLDAVKGGGLAAAAHPARVEAFAVSDVPGDALLDVASGPTVGDPGAAADAVAVLDRHGVAAPAARAALAEEASGRRPGPPRPGDPRLARTTTRVVASARRSLDAAAGVFEANDVRARILDAALVGDAREAARAQADVARRVAESGELAPGDPCPPPVALLSGGETTHAVRGGGRGGRNSAFALAFALALPERAPVWALFADSDGIDGAGGHAGAFVDPGLFARLPREEALALDADDDSRAAFERAGALLETGPTRTNVGDLRFVWVDPPTSGTGAAEDEPAAIGRAADRLRAGGLVAFPTETVYGLGALARDPSAVAEIFRAKGRPADHPLIVHLASADALARWASPVPEAAARLAHAFWPGPLTLVLNRAPGVPDVVTGGQDTIGVRVPDHPVALALLAEVDDGVAAPSANRFGRVSPTRAGHVREEFADREDLLILDGGPARVGLESTIVDLSGDAPRLLRPGAIPVDELEAALGAAVVAADADAPRAPGRRKGHYAPAAPTRVLSGAAIEAGEGLDPAAGLLLRIAAPPAGHEGPRRRLPSDPAGYGHGLYAALRELDAEGPARIVVEAPPDAPGWAAVADRLARAEGAHADDAET